MAGLSSAGSKTQVGQRRRLVSVAVSLRDVTGVLGLPTEFVPETALRQAPNFVQKARLHIHSALAAHVAQVP